MESIGILSKLPPSPEPKLPSAAAVVLPSPAAAAVQPVLLPPATGGQLFGTHHNC